MCNSSCGYNRVDCGFLFSKARMAAVGNEGVKVKGGEWRGVEVRGGEGSGGEGRGGEWR
jgi:hypothetical protein